MDSLTGEEDPHSDSYGARRLSSARAAVFSSLDFRLLPRMPLSSATRFLSARVDGLMRRAWRLIGCLRRRKVPSLGKARSRPSVPATRSALLSAIACGVRLGVRGVRRVRRPSWEFAFGQLLDGRAWVLRNYLLAFCRVCCDAFCWHPGHGVHEEDAGHVARHGRKACLTEPPTGLKLPGVRAVPASRILGKHPFSAKGYLEVKANCARSVKQAANSLSGESPDSAMAYACLMHCKVCESLVQLEKSPNERKRIL